jgi:hypothetical protein
MNGKIVLSTIAVAFLGSAALLAQSQQQPLPAMSFFIAANPTGAGNLGGIAGADQLCQNAAQASGGLNFNHIWHAYLSQEQRGNAPRLNARDRIGDGPWYNAKGQLIASNVADLHGDQQRDRNNIQRATALDARGNEIPGSEHDILTGSDSLGRAFTDGIDHTCNNWTSDGMTLPQANPNIPPDRARHARSYGPDGRPERIVERGAYEPGLQQAGANQHRRHGPDLLLCHRLKGRTFGLDFPPANA